SRSRKASTTLLRSIPKSAASSPATGLTGCPSFCRKRNECPSSAGPRVPQALPTIQTWGLGGGPTLHFSDAAPAAWAQTAVRHVLSHNQRRLARHYVIDPERLYIANINIGLIGWARIFGDPNAASFYTARIIKFPERRNELAKLRAEVEEPARTFRCV